jgi:large repetitive protein
MLVWLVALGLPASAQTISGFTPAFGGPGTVVTITGTGLNTVSQVKFGNSPMAASFDPPSGSTQITAVVPADALTGPISVTLNAGTLSSSGTFTVRPRVDSFNPALGNVGAQVTVFGANFIAGQTTVRFGSVQAAPPSVTAANQLVTHVPAGAVSGPISVSTFAGTNVTTSNFVVSGAAIITGFTPAIGPTGSVVVISGGDFTGATAVRFNGVNASSFAVTAASQIHATVPPTATTGPLSVVTPSGTATTTSNFVVSGLAPIVTGFAPFGGKAGDPVVISGLNFTTATNVSFNGVTAVAFLTSDTQISATVPAGATTGPIRVINPAGTNTTGSNFIIGPFITGFSPTSAQVGAEVVVDGLNFLEVTNVALTSASGGFTNAAFTITAGTQLRATVPVGATNGPVRVISPSGTNISSSNLIVFALAPVLTSFTPTNGLPGSSVQLNGANFLGATNVLFNGVSATFNTPADSQINATVPAAATTGPIIVSTPGGSVTSSVPFYLPPRLTSFSPATGPVATAVTLTGTNFTGVSSVTFAGPAATLISAPVTSVSATQMTVLVPTNAISGVITVTTPGGVIAGTGTFTVTPRVDAFTPLLGPVGTTVTVSGHSFTGATAVRFNGVGAGFSSVTDTQLVAVVPPGASTGPLTIVTPEGAGAGPFNFIVTANPNLAVLMTNSPSIVDFGSNVTITVVVTNQGSSIATGVTVTDTLPAGYGFVSATSTRGTCTFLNGVVTCPIGALTNGTAVTLTIVATASINGLSENRAQLTLTENDPSPGDNFGSLYIPVITEGDRTLAFDFTPGSPLFVLRWPDSAANFKLEFNTNLVSTGNVWTVVAEPVVVVTNDSVRFLSVTNTTGVPRKFYRLRAP